MPDLLSDRLAVWLRTLGDAEPVGYPRDPCRCPVAEFLRALGYTVYGVSQSIVWYRDGQGPRAVFRSDDPLLFRFIVAIDALHPDGPVRAADARAELRRVRTGA